MKNLNQLLIEISARAKMTEPMEANIDGIDVHVFRFDLVAICGDFETVNVPMAFSSEQSARAALYQKLAAR